MAHDNSKPFLDKIKDFWIDVSTRESQVVKDNNGNQIEKNNKERSRLYCKLIMMLALSSVFWSGAKNAVSKLKGSVLCVASIYINFALISMMIGAAAGTIPDVFRWHLGLSGNGVLQGLLFNIIAFNCELFTSLMADSLDKLHQIVLYWVTGGTSAVAVTIIWTWTTEDPLCALVALRIIWRFLQWIICSISSCICGMATKKLKKQVNQNDDQTLKDSLVNRTEAAHDSGCP